MMMMMIPTWGQCKAVEVQCRELTLSRHVRSGIMFKNGSWNDVLASLTCIERGGLK